MAIQFSSSNLLASAKLCGDYRIKIKTINSMHVSPFLVPVTRLGSPRIKQFQ